MYALDRDRILAIVREREPELRALGLLHLRSFGSVARGDQNPDSDVDLLLQRDESENRNNFRAYGCEDDVAVQQALALTEEQDRP